MAGLRITRTKTNCEQDNNPDASRPAKYAYDRKISMREMKDWIEQYNRSEIIRHSAWTPACDSPQPPP
jgi:hypothetical protein